MAENPTLSVLIGLIISLVLAVAFIKAYLILTEDDVSEKCFNDLTKAIKDAKDGTAQQVTCSLDDTSHIIVGFDKNQEGFWLTFAHQFDSPDKTIGDASGEYDVVAFESPRPAECMKGKPCLCLCAQGAATSFCAGKLQCSSFDGFDAFSSGYAVSFANKDDEDHYARLGYSLNVEEGVVSKEEVLFVTEEATTVLLNVVKKGDLVSFCVDTTACGTHKRYSDRLKEQVNACKEKKGCDCGLVPSVDISLKQNKDNVEVKVGELLGNFVAKNVFTLENQKICVVDEDGKVSYLDELILPDDDYNDYWESGGIIDGSEQKIRLRNVGGEVCFAKINEPDIRDSEDLTCEVNAIISESEDAPVPLK